MNTISKLSMLAALLTISCTAQAGILASEAGISVEENYTFSLDGAANFTGFQNGNVATHESIIGAATLSFANSEMWSAGCEGGLECTLSLEKSELASATDGSAINKAIDTNRRLFLAVEDNTTLTAILNFSAISTFQQDGDGTSPNTFVDWALNSIVLDDAEPRIVPQLVQSVSAVSVQTTDPLPFTFSFLSSFTESYDLLPGLYMIDITGGFLEARASQGGLVSVSEPHSAAVLLAGIAGIISVRRRRT